MELADDLVVDQTSLEHVAFYSIDIQPVIANLSTMIPPGIKRLSFQNNAMTSFDVKLDEEFASLNSL